MSDKHVFLTGANGFIGSHILERLLSCGYEVTILLRKDSDISRIRHCFENSNLHRITQDDMELYFSENSPDIVLHLATCYRKYHLSTDISQMIFANVDLPTQICQLCATHGVRYFINTGSFFEYDFADAPITEDSREKAFNLYASTKQAFNSVLKYYTEQYDFQSLTIRLFSPYGPRDNEKLIPVAIRSLQNGSEMKIANATQRLNFTYVDDIVDAYMLAIEEIPSFHKKYEVVNIAPKETYSLMEVLHDLESISGKKLQLVLGDGTEKDIWHSSFGSDYAEELLGWHAKTSIQDGLYLTYKSYTNGI